MCVPEQNVLGGSEQSPGARISVALFFGDAKTLYRQRSSEQSGRHM